MREPRREPLVERRYRHDPAVCERALMIVLAHATKKARARGGGPTPAGSWADTRKKSVT